MILYTTEGGVQEVKVRLLKGDLVLNSVLTSQLIATFTYMMNVLIYIDCF